MQKISSKAFFINITKLALPIMAQNFLHAFLLFVNILMISQTDFTSIASFGLAWTLIFGVIIIFFGITSGSTFFIKRFLSKNNFYSIKIFILHTLSLNLIIAFIFTLLYFIKAKEILTFIYKNGLIVESGLVFFKLASLTLPIIAFNTTISNYLSLIGFRKLITKVLSANIILTILLNYILIFHVKIFASALESMGYVMIFVRSLELFALLGIFLSSKNTFIWVKTKDTNYDSEDFKELWAMFLKIVLPIIFLEIGWVLSQMIFKLIFAYKGLREIVAYTIVDSFSIMYSTVFVAIATVASVVIGSEIQKKNLDMAEFYAKTFIRLNFVIVVPLGLMLGIISPFIIKIYNLPSDIHRFLYQGIIMLSVLLSLRSYNYLMMLGIHRAGGDTRFTVILGFICMVVIAGPLGYYVAFVLKKPYFAIFLVTFIEENIRNLVCLWRYNKKRYLKFDVKSYE